MKASCQPSHTVAVTMRLAAFRRNNSARLRICYVVALIRFADCRCPILFTIDVGQGLGAKAIWRTIVNDLTKLQADDPLGKQLCQHLIETDPGQELECLVHIALWKFPHETLPNTDITKSAAQHIFLDGEPFDQGVFLENHSHPPACAA